MGQDPTLLGHAATMRHAATPFEVMLWRHLSRSQLGYKFRRQHVLGDRIVDFFCPARNIAVEVDGDTHDSEQDRVRDAQLSEAGITVVRFTNAEIRDNLAGVLQHLLSVLKDASDRWAVPHPNPSPKGEGLETGHRL